MLLLVKFFQWFNFHIFIFYQFFFYNAQFWKSFCVSEVLWRPSIEKFVQLKDFWSYTAVVRKYRVLQLLAQCFSTNSYCTKFFIPLLLLALLLFTICFSVLYSPVFGTFILKVSQCLFLQPLLCRFISISVCFWILQGNLTRLHCQIFLLPPFRCGKLCHSTIEYEDFLYYGSIAWAKIELFKILWAVDFIGFVLCLTQHFWFYSFHGNSWSSVHFGFSQAY